MNANRTTNCFFLLLLWKKICIKIHYYVNSRKSKIDSFLLTLRIFFATKDWKLTSSNPTNRNLMYCGFTNFRGGFNFVYFVWANYPYFFKKIKSPSLHPNKMSILVKPRKSSPTKINETTEFHPDPQTLNQNIYRYQTWIPFALSCSFWLKLFKIKVLLFKLSFWTIGEIKSNAFFLLKSNNLGTNV